MTKYVISTEDSPNLPELVQKTLERFNVNGFRIVKAQGYWRGQRELSAHIEIIAEDSLCEEIKKLATRIRNANLQEAVLLEKYPVSSEVI